MTTRKTIENMVVALPGIYKDYPFGEGVAVYRVRTERPKDQKTQRESQDITKEKREKSTDRMFALIDESSDPVRLSLKCDPGLAELLRDKYETVLPGYHLNKKHWNTIICSGQLPSDELRDLIRHSYELVTA